MLKNRWFSVLAGALGSALGVGVFIVYVLGGFTKPLIADLGLDRSVMSFSVTCFLITTGFGTVTLGMLISRYGVRAPSILFVLICAATVAALPLLPPVPLAFYALFGIMGFFGAAANAMPYSVAITSLFDRRRGIALALCVAGGGLGATIGPQFAALLLNGEGWRAGLHIAGAVLALPALGLAVLVHPRAVPGEVVSAPGLEAPRETHWQLYLGHRAFWLIAALVLGISVGTFGVLATLVPLLTDRGFTMAEAATIMSGAGLFSFFGRIVIGWMLDHVWAPLVASALCFGTLAGILLIYSGGDVFALMLIGAALNGLALGSEADLLTYLCGRYFSFRAYSRVVGALWVVWAWGGGLGTASAGLAFRLTQSYSTSMAIFMAVLLVSGAVILRLGPYVYPAAGKADNASDAAPSTVRGGGFQPEKSP